MLTTVVFTSCDKESVSDETSNQYSSKEPEKLAAFCCDLPEGWAGVECKASTIIMCTESFSCTESNGGQTSNYNQVLSANYSASQIQNMYGKVITDQRLINALKADGMPIR